MLIAQTVWQYRSRRQGSPGYLDPVGAAGDCELIGTGLLGQPVNAITSLVFAIAGLWVVPIARMRWVGAGLVATGLGSFAFHGAMPIWGEWAHDVTLAWLIALIGGIGTRWEPWSRLPALGVLGLLFALAPITADPVAVALAVIVIGSLLLRDRSRESIGPLMLLGASAILGRLGATGGPLCDPDSVWQLHGLWHVGAAVAVAWWATSNIPKGV